MEPSRDLGVFLYLYLGDGCIFTYGNIHQAMYSSFILWFCNFTLIKNGNKQVKRVKANTVS